MNNIQKAFYTPTDPRMNLYEVDGLPPDDKQTLYSDLAEIQTNALATACLIRESMLKESMAGDSYTLSTSIKLSQAVNAMKHVECPLKQGEKFADEPVVGFGTGFLVSPSKLLTAGHCISEDNTTLTNIEGIRIIFNFHLKNKNTCQNKFDKKEVYRIKRVIYYQHTPNVYDKNHILVKDNSHLPDWALIKLDRKVVGITPFHIKHNIQIDTRVYMLGHPTGLPLKFSGEARIKKDKSSEKFECDLAAFGGNSGSPVIDRINNVVVGILVRGHYDYEPTPSGAVAHRVTQKEIDAAGWEVCQKITPLMLDPHQIIAMDGRAKRKALSNTNAEEFEKLQSGIDETMKSPLFGLAHAVLHGWPFPLNVKENPLVTVQKKFGDEINLREAQNITQLNADHLPDKDKISVARSMVAYGLSEKVALKLHKWEIDKFKNRFSPDKILELLHYQDCLDITLDDTESKRILKYLQIKDPKNTNVVLRYSDRREVLIEARIEVCVKAKTQEPIYSNYPLDDIKKISKLYVERQRGSKRIFKNGQLISLPLKKFTFEDARVELQLPDP